MKQLVIYDNQGRELSRINLPENIEEADEHKWARKVFKDRRDLDKRYDHFQVVKP